MSTSVRMPHVDDRVRLLEGVPNTALTPGQVGVVCSEWAGSSDHVYEVEFVSHVEGDGAYDDVTRRLLRLEQISLLEHAFSEA